MKRLTQNFLFLLSCILCLNACQYLQSNKTQKNGKIIAQVNDEYLYESDIDLIQITAKTAKDSSAKVLQYTNNWLKENAVLIHAKEQLNSEELDKIDKQVEDYRKSLIMYSYERALASQKMDTSIKEIDISRYYLSNIKNFYSNNDLIKIRYMILPNSAVELEEVKESFKDIDLDSSVVEQLQDVSFKYSAKHSLEGQWFNYEDFIRRLNVSTVRSPEDFLKNNKELTYADSLMTYLVKIDNYTLAGDTMNLEYCQNDIKALILNQRKKEFISNTKNNIYKDAVDNNEIQIFNK